MGEKKDDPENPVSSEHLEHFFSNEKQDTVLDAELARNWSRDAIKNVDKTQQKNPLASLSKEQLLADVEAFAQEKELEFILDDLKKGALVAQDPKAFESLDELSEEEKEWLRREKTHRWHQPFMMYFMTSKLPLLWSGCERCLT